MKKTIYSISAILFFTLLLINPSVTSEGAKNGLLLWFNVVLPSLLPFIIISNVIISLNATSYLAFILKPFLTRLLRISPQGIYAFIIGLLSGYPLGAKASADLVANKSISKKEGQYLLAFCNNVSPMFIISYIAAESLKIPNSKYIIITIVYLSSIITAIILKSFFIPKSSVKQDLYSNKNKPITKDKLNSKINFKIIDNSIMNGFETITKIGGYIILFSILSTFISNIEFQNKLLKCILIGIIEITTGISYITGLTIPTNIKIVLITALTAFGGLSGLAQTESVINQSGLSSVKYILCKLLNMIIALCLAIIYFTFWSL